MPVYDYALLALLASGGQGMDGLTLTLGTDAIVQPKGGGLILFVSDPVKSGAKIKIGEIKGESLDDKHKDEIEVLSKKNQNKLQPQRNQPPNMKPK